MLVLHAMKMKVADANVGYDAIDKLTKDERGVLTAKTIKKRNNLSVFDQIGHTFDHVPTLKIFSIKPMNMDLFVLQVS